MISPGAEIKRKNRVMKRIRIGIAVLWRWDFSSRLGRGGSSCYAGSGSGGEEERRGKSEKEIFLLQKGRKVKNKWVSIKSKGKTQKYYFGKNGAAYTEGRK